MSEAVKRRWLHAKQTSQIKIFTWEILEAAIHLCRSSTIVLLAPFWYSASLSDLLKAGVGPFSMWMGMMRSRPRKPSSCLTAGPVSALFQLPGSPK